MRVSIAIILLGVCFAGKAQMPVEKFTVDGNTYYGTKAIPKEMEGLYQYEKTKEPIVEIKEGGVGKFQVHDVPAYPAEFWIETDEKGVIQKRTGANTKNYIAVLILKYGDNGQSGWRGANKDKFDRIEVALSYDQGFAIILGERFKKLP